jgi:hypothetical protein
MVMVEVKLAQLVAVGTTVGVVEGLVGDFPQAHGKARNPKAKNIRSPIFISIPR